MTCARRSAVFEKKTDDAIVRQIVTDAGLAVGTLAATTPEHPEMVQYRATDWDFILSRADAQGQLVLVDDGAVSLAPMAAPALLPRGHLGLAPARPPWPCLRVAAGSVLLP